ncbi:MAG TPA: amidohydrolase family protein [Chloroflexota bacterium]|nr:amidohydrolase family protein [Chloroflexota bacterium]
MIVDSHCHAWRYWPYSPPVPDPESRPAVDQLIFEMDACGVDQAVLVAARIEHNPDNNDYAAEAVRRFPERLFQFADVDCMWTPTYHVPGAADRLAEAVRTYNLRGFTHYVDADDDGAWFFADDGQAFLNAAARLNQIVSIHLPVHLQPALRRLAEQFPATPFVCHHMGYPVTDQGPDGAALKDILVSARLPNIHIKLSGFHYATPVGWEYPHAASQYIVRALYEHFGAERLHWGSDYPPVRWAMTYRQTLEVIRTHCAEFIPPAAMERVLGGSLHDLLQRHG